jgi:predicted dehydrogenase
MKILVIGGGSIGSRHLRNLQSAGAGALAVAEPDRQRRAALCVGGVLGFESFHDGLDWQPNLVVIASPSHLHIVQALEVVRRGCHVFIEKPLAHTSDGLAELEREIAEHKLISLVGCNMRFHPGPAQVKALLDDHAIGRVLFARIHAGSYLPAWRPAQDYRASYSAHAAMGGGCILDYIHELDLARWYLGSVRGVVCVAGKISDLEADAEDVAALICTHHNGALSEIHLDYVQRTYERGCQIVGERGSIFWDYGMGQVRLYRADDAHWVIFDQPANWDTNQMYIDQQAHLLECIQSGSSTTQPVSEAIHVMRMALAAKVSASEGRLVEIAGAC